MKNFQEGIDNLVNKILSEEIEAKVKQIMENKGEWEEELHGGQSKIDVAEPKGKITAADFKRVTKKRLMNFLLILIMKILKRKKLKNYLKENRLMLVEVLPIIK
jgi:hypothetical protein